MRKYVFVILTLMTTVFFAGVLCSCSSSYEDNESELSYDINDNDSLTGMSSFIESSAPIMEKLSEVSYEYDSSETRTAKELDDTINAQVKLMAEYTKELLSQNDIDITNEFDDAEDYRTALVGMALLDYQKSMQAQTRGKIGNCVLEAIGIKDLYGRSVRYVAKRIIIISAKRFIPYIGWALTISDFATCIWH